MPYVGKRRRTFVRGASRMRLAKRRRTTYSSGRCARTARRYRPYNRIPRTRMLIVPDKAFCKFKAADTWNFSYTSPGTSDFMWLYANNPYDPIAGASTTACTGYSTMMTLYNKCMVYGCRVKAGFVQTTASGSELFGYIHQDISSTSYAALLTQAQLCEGGLKHLTYRLLQAPIQSNQVQPVWIKNFARTKDLEQKRELEPASYACTASAGPTIKTNAMIGLVHAGTGLTDGFAVRVLIRVTYYCKLFDKKALTA